jgi:hypothetical protein
LLLRPTEEWQQIEAETDQDQRPNRYFLSLSLLPAISLFLGLMLISSEYASHIFGAALRASFVVWLIEALTLLISVLAVFIISRNFGSTVSNVQVGRLTAFSFTPFWLLSLLLIISPQHIALWSLVGLVWGTYLIYVGAPVLLKIDTELRGKFAIVAGGSCVACFFIARAIVGAIF